MSLIENFDESQLESFSKDLFLVMNVIKNIDEEYADAKQEFIHDFAHLKEIIKLWNKKYPNLTMSHLEDGMQLKLLVKIKEKDIREVVKAASKIDNLVRINNKNIPLGNIHLGKLDKSVDMVFMDKDNNENSLTLVADGEVNLIFNPRDMITPDSPEFEISAFYALKQVEHAIDIQIFSTYFSFNTDLEAQEGKGISYLDRVRLFDRV